MGKTSGIFNTPRAEQVDDLFKKVIGLQNLSHKWQWSGKTHEDICAELDALITLRGSIAHRVKADSTVTLEQVTTAETLVLYLAVRSHNETKAYLSGIGCGPKWDTIAHQGHK